MITRDQILANAGSWPRYRVEYSQSDYFEGHRADCSGYVSMCWGLAQSYNTATIVNLCTEIPFSELQPGDALGKCGPGTEGDNGHIQLFIKWVAPGSTYEVMEQTPYWGPQLNHYIGPGDYKAYRFNGVEEVTSPPIPTLKGQKMHLVRSGAADGSVYLVGGAVVGDKLVAVGVHDPHLLAAYAAAGIPTVQLPTGVTVPSTGTYLAV